MPAELNTRFNFQYVVKIFPCKPPEIIESQSHTFKLKTYRHPRDCDLCKQVIWSEGVQCRVCKYACHKKCELKVITTCVPPMNYELPSNEGLAKHGSLKMTQPSVQKDTMSQQKMRLPKGEESMYIQLTYITERILAMTFPANGQESHYSSNLQDITRILKNKHQDKYLVINLSEKRYDMLKLNSQVLDIGWPDRLSPPLEKLCSICKAIESWLSTDPQHVVVIHSKGGLGRLGVVLSAYIEYIRICNGNGNHSPEKFAMERFFVENLSAVTESSQMRYVKYFSGLLSGSIQINNSPLHLHCVVLHGIPNFDGKGGCRPFFKVYQAMQPIYTSGVYTLTSNMSRLAVPIKPAPPLRGDIMVICYHRNSHSSTRDVIFRCQFHTCAIAQYHLAFVKYELDDASKDSKFPDYSKVELLFSDSAASLPGIEEMQDPHIPVDYSQDFVTQLDSYASFGQDTEDTMLETTVTDSDGNMVVQHMHGPVDGSLYAKVNKKGGGDDVTETLFNGPEHDHGHVHTHVHTHGHTHGHTHHHHSAHNHGMVLDLHGSTHDSVDGVTVNDRDHNRNETQVTKHYLTEGLKSPTETIKRGVKKEGMKPNTLKEWFTRRQPNSPADYTHHTLRRNKGGAAEIQDQSTQSQHAKTPTSPPTMSSTLPHSSFPHDSRNYPRDHVYRGGLRDDENPYAEIPDYAASSPTSSMTSGPPQTSSFSSLSEVTNLTYGTSHQSPTGRSASGPDDKSPQGLTMADGQTQSSVVHTMVHHDHLAHGHQGQHGYGHNTEHPGQSGHVHTQITGQYTHHDHMVHGHPGQAGHGHEVDPHGHHVHQHPGQSGHVHTHITGQHSHHDQMVHGHPGQAGHGLEVDPHGHHVHEHTTTNITQQVNERQDHSIHGHPAHVSQSGHGPGVTQPGHGGHVHQHTSTVTGQGHDHAGPISHSQHGPGVSHPGQVGHVQQHTTVTTERQEHVVHGHPDQTSTPGHPSHVHQPSVTVTGQPARGIQVEHVHPENQPGQVTHIHQGGHVTYPAGQVQYTTEKGQYTVQGDKTTHLAGQPDQTGQSSGQPGQTSHVHKVQYTTLQDQLSPKSGHPYLMGHSHSPEVIQKPGETYHLYHDASERAPQSFHLHSRSEPIPQSAEQTQVTRVVQVHSTNNHNQPVGVIDVHHPANQSPQAQPHSHPLANQNQPPSMDRPAVTSHHPSGIQTQYQVTKYEVTEHQHQHSPGEPVSPTKQTWAQRHQQQQQQLSPPPQDTIVQPQQNPPQSLPQQTSTQNQTQVITTQHTWSTQQHMPTQPNLTVQQQKSPTEQTAVEKQPSHVPAVQQPQPAAPTQQAAAEEDPFEGLTWLQKQQKKLELRRQQEKEAQQPGAAPSTSVTKYQYTTYTDRPTYKPLLSPYSTSSQSTTYQYLTPGGQYKPLSPTSQVSTQYNSQGQPQPFTVKDQSPTGFADIDINQLEALAQSLQDESELLDQYTSAPTSPRGSSSTTTVWQSHGRPLSRQHSDRTHDRAVLSHRYGGQTRPYSPYEMDVTVKKLPPPSPRLGRNEAIKTPPPAAPDSGKTTTTTRQIHTEFHQVEEPVVRGPMHGRFFTTPSSVRPVNSSPLQTIAPSQSHPYAAAPYSVNQSPGNSNLTYLPSSSYPLTQADNRAFHPITSISYSKTSLPATASTYVVTTASQTLTSTYPATSMSHPVISPSSQHSMHSYSSHTSAFSQSSPGPANPALNVPAPQAPMSQQVPAPQPVKSYVVVDTPYTLSRKQLHSHESKFRTDSRPQVPKPDNVGGDITSSYPTSISQNTMQPRIETSFSQSNHVSSYQSQTLPVKKPSPSLMSPTPVTSSRVTDPVVAKPIPSFHEIFNIQPYSKPNYPQAVNKAPSKPAGPTAVETPTTTALTNPTYDMTVKPKSYYSSSQHTLPRPQASSSPLKPVGHREPSPYKHSQLSPDKTNLSVFSHSDMSHFSSISSSPLSAPPPPRSGYSPSLGDSANRPSVMPPARSEPAETGQKPLPKPENIVSAETPHEEPDLKGLVRDRVAGYHARLIRDELNTERGRQPGRKPAAPLRRSKSAAGYDSETSHRQYITETERVAIVQRRARSPSPEVWMRNPGGIPQYENEYWNKRDGLKSPHTVQDEDTGTTPKFPVSPGPPPKTPYANMVSTPIAFVEKFAVPMETVSGMTPSHGRMHESNNKIIVTRNVPPPTTMPSKSYYVTKMIDSREVYQTSTVSKDSQHEERPADVQHMFRYPDTSYVHTVDQHDAPPQTHQHKPAVTSHPGQGSAINGGPPAPHPSQDKKPNGQPPMMHQWDRPDKAREGQSYTMRELYVETQTQDKKTMAPHDSHVPALAIAEQTSLPHTHPPQQGMPPGQQHTVTRTVVQKTETHTLEKGAPHQPHLHQAPEQQGSPQYQNHPYPGVPSEQAMPHDHRMHGPGKTVVDSSQGVPPNQVRPEGPVVQTHYHIHQTMQEHRNSPVTSLPAPQAGERESPVDQPLTPLHITEDSGSLSECSESPQSSNQGYESATLPFPTSSAMMKERLELQRHQGQPVQQQQVPPNLYPTYSDRARQPGNPPANLYPTFSDRGREHTGHVTITTETTSQYRTMYDNRGRRGDQQKSPDMGRTISRGSASSGENMSGILGSSPRRVTSLGSSHGRGSLTGSDRSGSPPPVGVGNRIYPNGGVSDSGRSSPISLYNQPSLLGSQVSLPDGSEIITKHPTFVKDISSYWYKPNISRDEAIATLKDKPPGSFVVRDSNSFPGAFGLAVKVATPPPNIVQNKKGDLSNELVRHFLIEPNSRGVRLKGCTNEPIFSSLSALVYQHSITPLALPCKLLLPEVDPSGPSSTASSPRSSDVPASPSALLAQGAACNVLYLHSVEMESLTGPNAVRKAVTKVTKLEPRPRVTVVHFKVNSKGITLTDNEKKVFFRRHHPVNSVTYCGMDPENRKWPRSDDSSEADAKIFGFVARKPGSLTDNVCHLFAEHDPEQPASAIVNFVTKVMIGSTQQKK
ncbi:uncharacterized protein [Ptychodera flava]|uniref:uncharacterized protein isoform X3 n=1 Tax=Ptychodera flava TaxID=63121 RepID=UPI00396A533B